MIKLYKEEEFFGNIDIFNKCEKLYLNKFSKEKKLEFDNFGYSTFFTYEYKDNIIGFGYYHDNNYMYIVETIFNDEFKYLQYHKELLDHIINLIKQNKKPIWAYQTLDEDYVFYINNGFKLLKDYELFFRKGFDMTRFIFEYKFD